MIAVASIETVCVSVCIVAATSITLELLQLVESLSDHLELIDLPLVK